MQYIVVNIFKKIGESTYFTGEWRNMRGDGERMNKLLLILYNH